MKPALSEQMITRRKSSYLKTPFYKSIWSDQRPPCLFLYEFTYEVNDIKLYLLKEISVCFIVGTHSVIATVNATTSLRRNAGRINGLARYFFFLFICEYRSTWIGDRTLSYSFRATLPTIISVPGRGILPEKLGEVVQTVSRNPYIV